MEAGHGLHLWRTTGTPCTAAGALEAAAVPGSVPGYPSKAAAGIFAAGPGAGEG